jgi:DNA polymerase-3 subunit alpha
MELKDWISLNKLSCRFIGKKLLEIEDFGKFFILPDKEKIINAELLFELEDSELNMIEKFQCQYILFTFGERWYYTSTEKKINDKYGVFLGYRVKFNDFKYIGKAEQNLVVEDYTNLGIHSEYELLNGSHKAKDWAKKAKFIGCKTLGICDKSTLAGTLAFQMACTDSGIKPVFGMTVAVRTEVINNINMTYDLKLYVMDEVGWNNILKINKVVNVDNSEYRYIDEQDLFKYTNGLVAVFGKESLLYDIQDVKMFKKIVERYDSKEFVDIYFQIDTVEYVSDEQDLKHLNNLKFYVNNGYQYIKPILINDSYYLEQEEYELKQLLNGADNNKKVYPSSRDQYFKTLDDSFEKVLPFFEDKLLASGATFEDMFVQSISHASEVALNANFLIEIGQHKLPEFACDDPLSLFYELIAQGIEERLGDVEDIDEYLKRVEIECDVIVGAGFIHYFLILWDIIRYARENDIIVGVGRGSVGGSLIAYLLYITSIDPIKHDLLFERFLNKSRVSGERAKAADALPDIDIDFPSDKRDQIKDYMKDKYGIDYVCSIGTYGRLKLKSAMKDFARVKGMKFSYVNYITKIVDDQLDYEWDDLIMYALEKNNIDLYNFVQNNGQLCNNIKFVLGQAKTTSVHASAVIILPRVDKNGRQMDIFDWLPVRKIDGVLVSEWEGKYIDRAGFLKEDILGLSQLDKFRYMLDLIKKNHNKDVILDKIPLDDRLTYKLFQKGFNEDVFQFNSSGLKAFSRDVRPDCIEDLTAMNALYRPGPMESNAHKDFADIKHGKKKPVYDFGLKSVTEKTSGLYVYQEQIMQATVVLGGMTLVEADEIRTTIKKFDKVKLASYGEAFVKGAIKNGCPAKDAEKIWNKLLAFAGYGFNKSHSAAYAIIAYWSQYFKANYPLEFWTTALNYAKEEEVPDRLSELNKLPGKITVKPPDINNSDTFFTCDPETKSIYWSLSKIKGCGEKTVEVIINDRAQNGKYYSMEEFWQRVPKAKINKKIFQTLIFAGCFDEMEGITNIYERVFLLEKHCSWAGCEFPKDLDIDLIEKKYIWVMRQRDLIGYGEIDFVELLKMNRSTRRWELYYESGDDFLTKSGDWKEVVVCGILVSFTKRDSKNGPFFVLRIDSNNSTLFVTLWNDYYKEFSESLPEMVNRVIAIKCKKKLDTYKGINCAFSYDKTELQIL